MSLMRKKVDFDSETKKWFETHPTYRTTVSRCNKCGLYFKPSLGHVCAKGNDKNDTKRKMV